MFKKNIRRAKREGHDSIMEVFSESERGILLWTAKLFNFSTTGASFLTAKNLNKGDYVSARIRILEKGVMEITGKIVRTKKESKLNLYGIRFESVKKIR